jgi:hypothetical protein
VQPSRLSRIAATNSASDAQLYWERRWSHLLPVQLLFKLSIYEPESSSGALKIESMKLILPILFAATLGRAASPWARHPDIHELVNVFICPHNRDDHSRALRRVSG